MNEERRWGACARCGYSALLVQDHWLAGYRGQKMRWICNPCDGGLLPVNTQEGMGR